MTPRRSGMTDTEIGGLLVEFTAEFVRAMRGMRNNQGAAVAGDYQTRAAELSAILAELRVLQRENRAGETFTEGE